MSRQTIRFLAALGGVTVSTAIIGCADAPVGPLTGVEFRSELVLSYDPCQHSALDNLVDFGDLQIGDGSYAGLYGVSDLGGD